MNSPTELARLEVKDLAGVFAARQFGRRLAASLALDAQDQVRVATALSEVSRSVVTAGRAAVITFGVEPGELVLIVTLDGSPPADGIAAAARLMDQVTASGEVVRMTKRRPADVELDLRAVSTQLAAAHPQSALDDLRRQNQDLISALEDLRKQKEQLLLLNGELQETNRGVMALYSELSSELEQTNRGVVALYAELDETSQRLRAASESKDRFWANVSHELRTPLNSIIGLARLLADPGPGSGPLDSDQLYQVELIKNSGTVLLTLVNDLLDVAKAESGRLHTDPAQVDLPALFGRLRGLARPMAEGKPVEVVVSDDGVPGTLLTDEVALTSILRNLLSNGIKYTDRGEVRLSAQVAGPRLEITVADTGIGIPPGLQENVFEEFYQVPGTGRGGTGLGLPYARRLARILGGELRLASQPGGTTVVLSLPNQTPAVGTVVVADDDPAFRQVIVGLLSGLAGRLLEASDGNQALELLNGTHVDLVLADMRMPGMDGGTLLTRLPASMPAVIITGTDVAPPPRAAAVLRKDELTRERLEFTLRGIFGGTP
jgi:signal transduction histidine kinase/CheY-like chemotaxis protein